MSLAAERRESVFAWTIAVWTQTLLIHFFYHLETLFGISFIKHHCSWKLPQSEHYNTYVKGVTFRFHKIFLGLFCMTTMAKKNSQKGTYLSCKCPNFRAQQFGICEWTCVPGNRMNAFQCLPHILSMGSYTLTGKSELWVFTVTACFHSMTRTAWLRLSGLIR